MRQQRSEKKKHSQIFPEKKPISCAVLGVAVPCVVLWVVTVACLPARGLSLCWQGCALGSRRRLILLEVRAGCTNPSLLGESHDTGDINEMWDTPSQTLQMFSSRHLLPFLPHLPTLLPTLPE